MTHTVVGTTLGEITLVAEDGKIAGLYFRHHWHKPAETTFGERVDASTDPLFRVAGEQLDEYLSGARAGFDLPTVARGDAFQKRVWGMLQEIPYGQTATYGELAQGLGDKILAQEVGQAVGRNPLCVVVPCHRVVGKGGKLTGYAGGLKRKRFLLELEEAA